MRDLALEIFASIRRNKLRTCLTGFAVAWGIFMLIVLLGAGHGLFNAFTYSGEDFASNIMTLYGGVTTKPYEGYKQGRYVPLRSDDADLLKTGELGRYVDDVTASITKGGFTLNYGKRHFDNVSLKGTFPEVQYIDGEDIVAGRFINDNDIRLKRKVIVISHLLAKNLLSGSDEYERIVGKNVKVGNVIFRIVGVRKGAENNNDRTSIVPYTTVKTIFKYGNEVDQVSFTFHGLPTEADNELFEKNLKATVNKKHNAAPDDEGALYIWNRFTQNLQMNKVTGILETALWVLGLFTLMSGIVGVSNIMLITVRERTHEFGVRKAIGATPWKIMKLVMSESVVITIFFGYIGMILGLVGCEVLNSTVGQQSLDLFGQQIQMLKDPFVDVGTAIGATIVLIVAGTIAGAIPARKAAKVKPIEALMSSGR